jgi:hypothetical protein
MAKKGGSGKTYTSKGLHSGTSGSVSRSIRANRTEGDALIAKQAAWVAGGNPWVTIKNPNKVETNKPFIKVRMNDMMRGTAKDRAKNSYSMK